MNFFIRKQAAKALFVGLLFILGQAAWAENHRVTNGLLRTASNILGTPMIATQRIFRDDAIGVFRQGDTRFVRFTIQHGDIGGAPTDNDAEHSRRFNRPWSERVELRTRDTMRRNSIYEIKFRSRIVEGYAGWNSTVFQIHNGVKPPLMLFFQNFSSTEWTAAILEGCRDECGWNDKPEQNTYQRRVSHAQSMRRWIDHRVVLDTGSTPAMSIWIDGRPLVEDVPVTLPRDKDPYVRIGTYRGGVRDGQPTSVIDYSVLEVTRIGAAPD